MRVLQFTHPVQYLETSPGVFEPARHRYRYYGDPKPGDTIEHSELQADGTWTEWSPVRVVDA